MFSTTGILFNHESPHRGLEFVTRKITNAVAKISLGLDKNLSLGNLNAVRDWGYAPEFVEAIYFMLQQDKPDTFVICNGVPHKVKDVAKLAFELIGKDWKKHVIIDKKLFRPLDVEFLCGDCKKAKKQLGWNPKTSFEKLIKLMVEEDLKRWKMFLDGKSFPWDAPLYPSETKIISRNSHR